MPHSGIASYFDPTCHQAWQIGNCRRAFRVSGCQQWRLLHPSYLPPIKRLKTGVHCIAPGCTNHYYLTPHVSYHRLPVSEPGRLKQWLLAVKRKQVPDVKLSRLSSEHFEDADYLYKEAFISEEIFYQQKTNILKCDACPTKFNFSMYAPSTTDCPSLSTKTDSSWVRGKKYMQGLFIFQDKTVLL